MGDELRLAHLCKTYANGVRALDGVSLRIPPGMFGLLGPNGAGKSTLMRTIATLQDPDEGTITLGDLDVLKSKEAVRRVLGYLPQDFGLYPSVDALTLLDHFAALKGVGTPRERKGIVQDLLQRVNLWEVRKKKLGSYSGGMRQRFGIAQALLGAPRLIIVDEPTAGLDPQERNRFLNLLAEIGEQVVVILSTHIVEDVADLCTRMAILAGGRVLLEGEPASALEALAGKTWKKVIERADLPHASAEYDLISNRMFGGRTLIHVFSEVRPGPEFDPAEASLEDVYFTTLARRTREGVA